MDIETTTGILAASITSLYCGISYSRELMLAIRGESQMSVMFSFAATLTFASWVLHASILEQPNYWLLIPNATGFVFSFLLTIVLSRRRFRK